MTEDTELDAFLEDSAADAAETEDIVNELEQDPESMEPQTFTVRGHVCEIRFSRKRIDLYEERHTPIIASFYKNDGMFTFKERRSRARRRPVPQGGRLRVLRRQARLGLRAVRAAHARAARVRAQRA